MTFSRAGAPSHSAITGVTAAQHHTATVAGDLNLADMAARAHGDLSDAPANAHHTPTPQADQAALEGETNEDTYTPPDLIKHSPGVAKVWVYWEQTGAHGIIASYNMTSVTDGSGAGDTDHVWNVNHSGTSYAIIGSGMRAYELGPVPGTQAAGTVTTLTSLAADGVATDIDHNFLATFGDQ